MISCGETVSEFWSFGFSEFSCRIGIGFEGTRLSTTSICKEVNVQKQHKYMYMSVLSCCSIQNVKAVTDATYAVGISIRRGR